MAKVPMKRIFIAGLKSQRKQVLESLQREGCMEVIPEGIDPEGLSMMNVSSEKNSFDRMALRFQQALEALDLYAPEAVSLLDSLEGPEEIDVEEYENRLAKLEEAERISGKITALAGKIEENRTAIPRLESRLEALKPWMALDIPLNFSGTGKTAAFIGSLKNRVTREDVLAAIAEAAAEPGKEEPPAVEVTVISESKEMTCLFLICLKEEASYVENALKKIGFSRVGLEGMIPTEEAENIRQEIRARETQIAGQSAEIKSCVPYRSQLKFAADYYRMRADKYEVLSRVPQSENVFFLEGYVPEPCAGRLKKHLIDCFDVEVELADPGEEEEVPVLLKNNPYSEPMESVASGYSLPGKTEIDPSFILSLFYYLFFGLMLSDAGYGLLLTLGTGIVLLKVKNMKPGTKSLMKTFFFGGICTIFWGILFGSYFGDAIPVIARTFFHKEVTVPAVWFEPLSNPVKLLAFSFGLGIVHLFTGLFISGYQLLRQGKIWDAVCDVLFWFLFIGGLIVFAVSTPMICGMLQIPQVSAGAGNIAKWAALIGMTGIIFTAARDKTNWILRILLGLYGVYGATSWLSDILSYSRLLALGLATGVIAQVFNTLGTMLGASWYGILVFILVFLIGHVMNIAINLLGAYVHTNRLQYVEFFGKFYEGGGRPFVPFGENTKYYNVKEDK